MTGSVTLNDLSFESNEVLVADVDPNEAYVDLSDISNPDQLEQAQKLLDIYSTIINRGKVCRDDIERVESLAAEFPTVQKLLKRYPINSFTREPSMTNYEVSNESFVKTAYEAVVRALGQILRFFVEGMKRLWNFITQNAQRTAAVDDLKNRLHDLQKFIVDVDRVMAESEVAGDYTKARNAIFESERHNLSKSWNRFRQFVIEDETAALGMLSSISGTLRDQLPQFTQGVEDFLVEITNAASDTDIKTAVVRMELFSVTAGPLVALAHGLGWRPGSVRIADDMTPFQATTSYIRSTLRSWGNQRQEMSAASFTAAVAGMKNLAWSPIVNDLIGSSRARTERLMTKIKDFNPGSLKPGMEDAYANILTPFFKALLSILQGYMTLENCMGDLIANRDNATIAVSKSTLVVVKELDKYVKKNQDRITVFGRTVIAAQRRNVFASMGSR